MEKLRKVLQFSRTCQEKEQNTGSGGHVKVPWNAGKKKERSSQLPISPQNDSSQRAGVSAASLCFSQCVAVCVCVFGCTCPLADGQDKDISLSHSSSNAIRDSGQNMTRTSSLYQPVSFIFLLGLSKQKDILKKTKRETNGC